MDGYLGRIQFPPDITRHTATPSFPELQDLQHNFYRNEEQHRDEDDDQGLFLTERAGLPSGELAKAIDAEFGGFDRFKKEFSTAATSTEGSGWAALTYCYMTGRPIIMQIEKHNVNVFPGCPILLVLDVWEHAYYLDYKNDRAKYVEGFWNVVNWDMVAKRMKAAERK